MGGVILLALTIGCSDELAAQVPSRLTWEGAVPYLGAVGAPVEPPSWPIVGDPNGEDAATVGAWAETTARVCRGDPVAREAWLGALVAALASADGATGPRDAGLAEGMSCARPEFCAWARERYAAPDASPALRAALVHATARCDGAEDRSLRLARLDAHLLAGDSQGAIDLLAFLTAQGMTPWLSVALEARYAVADDRMRDALALGAAGSAWGPDDARAARLCLDHPDLGPCLRRASYERASVLGPDPAVDPDGWVRQWRADPVALVAARPELSTATVQATERCAADAEFWGAAACLRALAVLAPPRAQVLAATLRFAGASGDVKRVTDELLDAPGAGASLGLSGQGLLAEAAARASRAIRDDGDCEAMWRSALAPDPALEVAPKRLSWSNESENAILDVWIDGWRWRAEIGDEELPCPLDQTVAVANTRLRARGSAQRWGLVDSITAVSASEDAWKASVAAGVISPAVP